MNKKLLFGIALIALIVLGFFALQDNNSNSSQTVGHGKQQMSSGMGEMEEMSQDDLESFKEDVNIPFNKLYSIDDEWSLKIIQFEPSAKIGGPGSITSDTDKEANPAIKVNFYKDNELVHYQICYKEMPGFHSVKSGQQYLLDFIDYDNFKVLSDNKYSIESANVKLWSIK